MVKLCHDLDPNLDVISIAWHLKILTKKGSSVSTIFISTVPHHENKFILGPVMYHTNVHWYWLLIKDKYFTELLIFLHNSKLWICFTKKTFTYFRPHKSVSLWGRRSAMTLLKDLLWLIELERDRGCNRKRIWRTDRLRSRFLRMDLSFKSKI